MKTVTQIFVGSFFFCASFGIAQIGIGTTEPRTTLDVVGNPTDVTFFDGIKAPEITGDQLDAKAYTLAQTGAIVYVTAQATTLAGQVANITSAGYYYFNGTLWVKMLANSDKPDVYFTTNNNLTNIRTSETFGTSESIVALGVNSANGSIGNRIVAIGDAAAQQNSNNQVIAIGQSAARDNSGQFVHAIGQNAARDNSGQFVHVIGQDAARDNSGSNLIAIGRFAGRNNQGDNNIFIGSGQNLVTDDPVAGTNNILIGRQIRLTDNNASNQLNIQNIIFGTNSGSIVDNSTGSIGIGERAPNSKLHVGGSFAAPYVTTGSETLVFDIDGTHYTVRLFNDISGVQLPNPTNMLGRIYILIGSNGIDPKALTVNHATAIIYDDVTNDFIDEIRGGQRLMVQSDGTDWIVIGR